MNTDLSLEITKEDNIFKIDFINNSIKIGSCSLNQLSKYYCYLDSYNILKEFRGNGYGYLCLNYLLDNIKVFKKNMIAK